MSYVETLHAAHKERLARINGRAFTARPRPLPIAAPNYQRPAPAPAEPKGWNFQYEYAWHLEMIGVEIQDFALVTNGLRIDDIQRATANHYGILRMDMLSSRRTANLVRPRQVAMYLCKIMTTRSLPEIGRRFGGRDHTTVLHAVRKMAVLVEQVPDIAGAVHTIRQTLQPGA